MNCERIRELLFDYIDGELDENTADAVRAHLDGCDKCKKEYREMLGMSEAIRESTVKAPAELHSHIMSGISAEKKRVKRARLMRNLTAIGGCAAAFVIIVNVLFNMIDGQKDNAPEKNDPSDAPSISLKADNIFASAGSLESGGDEETVVLSESTFEQFVGEWKTELKNGTTVIMIISEDRSAVVCIRERNGYETYYDGMIEFKNGTATISQSDGNEYCIATIKAVKDEGKLYFDIVSGNTPWGEAI